MKCCTLVWSRLAERRVSLVLSGIPPLLISGNSERNQIYCMSCQSTLPAGNPKTTGSKMLFPVVFMFRHARIKHLCGSFIRLPLLSSCLCTCPLSGLPKLLLSLSHSDVSVLFKHLYVVSRQQNHFHVFFHKHKNSDSVVT